MRKHFLLLMLMALLPLASFAQRNVGDKFPAGNYVYRVTTAMDGTLPGEVTLIGIRDGKNPIVDNALVIPGQLTATLFEEDYTFNTTALGTDALQKYMDASGNPKGNFTDVEDAQSVEFPATIKALPVNCLKGYTNIETISFEANSELETIADGAFSTTQIKTFDFSNCSQLAELTNAVFVEASPATNSYITKVTLPKNSLLLKHIGTAFQRLSALKTIENLEKSAITEVVQDAFNGCTSLTSVSLPGTVQYIESGAFAASGITTLNIDVTNIKYIGIDQADPYNAANSSNVFGSVAADQKKLVSLTLTGNLGGIILKDAFTGCENLATLNLAAMNFASKGQIATNAFKGCTSLTNVTIGNINDQPASGCTIADNAFEGCTALATVTIGDINSANAIGAAAFGNKLKTVTIGTVKAGDVSITAGAFVWANVKNAELNLATATGKYLSCDEPTTKKLIGANAFNMSAITGAAGWVATNYPVVNIGEIKSKGGVFTAEAIKDTKVREINFKGDIAENGLDVKIFEAGNTCTVLNFEGAIATGGIATNAFKDLSPVMTITFKGVLAKEALASGAFEGLKADSKVKIDYTPADATVNPFAKDAFKAGSATVDTRIILLEVAKTNPLYAQFNSAAKGLTTDGVFDVYLVKFYAAPVEDDNTFLAYQNKNEKNIAWARINFSTDKLSETLMGGTSDLKIQRYQNVKDGENMVAAKLTLYATYTDEDDAEKVSTIYMVPLKVTEGYYHIAKTDAEVIIAKVAKVSGDFTNTDIKVPVAVTGYTAGNESLWTGLTNSELSIAQNIMTNQQLIDKTAKDGLASVDIYRGGTAIAEDLYVMANPAKYQGFDISKIVIAKGTGGKGAYIGEGWYYMLLKHYAASASAPAHVIWMDADPANDPNVTGIFEVKQSVSENSNKFNNAIYTLQGVRVSQTTKGQIYIQNGKKFIAK